MKESEKTLKKMTDITFNIADRLRQNKSDAIERERLNNIYNQQVEKERNDTGK